MSYSEIYLDANATTPVLPLAANAAFEAMQLSYGNPSSSHITGIKAKHIMENTRIAARKSLGAHNGHVIFTSGATEGIQTAIISGLSDAKKNKTLHKNSILLYGATEHKAVPETLKHWNDLLDINAKIIAIPVNDKGVLDHNFIIQHAKDAIMICTMAVNNETGVYQDLNALEKTIRESNPKVKWLVDGVQALGKMPLNLSNTTIDYSVFSGHKLYAPKGIGLLYIRKNAPYTPFIAGGGQESGLRSGTENLPGIAAIGAILTALNDEHDTTFKSSVQLHQYREQLATTITAVFDDVVFNNDFSYSVATTLNFSVPHLSAKEIMDLFDAASIRVSSGSACSSKVTGSYVLDAMGIVQWQSESAIRLSFGPAATSEEIDNACKAIKHAASALKTSCLITSNNADYQQGQLDGVVQLHHDGSCCWIIADKNSQQCVIVDPIEELEERIEAMVRCRQYNVLAVIDTHSHADHESSSIALKINLSDLMNDITCDQLGWPTKHETVTLANNDQVAAITIGHNILARLVTPGHTNDSISLLLAHKITDKLAAIDIQYAFVGDMILIGGLGRTDFDISSVESFYHSVQTLNAVTDKHTILCPAHDYNMEFTTTLNTEKASNCILRNVLDGQISEQEFSAQKIQVDKAIAAQQVSATVLMCGALSTCDVNIDNINLAPETAKAYMVEHSDAIVLDVREPHEHNLRSLDNVQHIKNVPITQLTGFMANMLRSYDTSQEVICFCRSGSRSAVVAKTLRRLGFDNARHVQGGIALCQ
jgi:cysteine desulfurase